MHGSIPNNSVPGCSGYQLKVIYLFAGRIAELVGIVSQSEKNLAPMTSSERKYSLQA